MPSLGPPGYLVIRTSRRRRGLALRRPRIMTRQGVVWLKWGCFELGLRYGRRGGWRPVVLVRLYGPGRSPYDPGTWRGHCEEEVCWVTTGRR